MLATQRKQAEVKDLLEYFQMTMDRANDLIQTQLFADGLNWTTYWVLLCGLRQEMSRDRDAFEGLVA